MNNKVLLLSVAVVAVGLFALPSTLSMFAGQHSWYDPKSDTGIPCTKCHSLEDAELSGSGGPHDPDYDGLINTSMDYGNGSGNPGGSDFWDGDLVDDRCYGCHQTTGSVNSTHDLYDTWDNQRNTVHAAVAVWCIDCHPWVENELMHNEAAHTAFYDDLNETGSGLVVLQDANLACLGCHTHVGVNITWTRNEYVSYNVTCDKTGYVVTWNTSDDLGTNESMFGTVPGYT